MRKSKFRWVAVAAACALLSPLSATPAAAEDEQVDVVGQVTAELVQQLRVTAADDIAQRDLYAALLERGVVDPTSVLAGSRSGAGQEFTKWAAEADRTVKDYLGLPRLEAAALRVYLADPARSLGKGQLPLFAVAPSNDEIEATTLTAFDLWGKPVELDLREAPRFPVIFADLDAGAIVDASLWVISEELNANGVLSDVLLPEVPPAPPTTRLDQITIKDVKEPGAGKWYCFGFCDAEVVAFTMGGSNGRTRVDVFSLHDVNVPNTTYNVMRNIINWSNFSWPNVDFLIMEMDPTPCLASSANYAQAISGAISSLGAAPSYVPLNPGARAALRDKKKICSGLLSYGVDLPDYIDSFYALSKSSVGTQVGVENNATTKLTLL